MEPSSSKQLSPALTGDIYAAQILVCCGRGLRDRTGFDLAVSFAEAVSGQIVGTRSAVDAGWIPWLREVGISGARVSPQLYIGCGVSGTNFHTIGMRHAETVVAINTDPLARIFTIAHIGIIGDAKDILTAAVCFFEGQQQGNFSTNNICRIINFFVQYKKRNLL